MEGVKNLIENLYYTINDEAEEEEEKTTNKYTIKDKLLELRIILERAKRRLIELKKEIGDPIGTAEVVTKDDLLVDDLEKHLQTIAEYAEMSQKYCDFLEGVIKFSIVDLKLMVEGKNLNPLKKFLNEMLTDKHCPKCGELLLKSDLPQYEYTCCSCDENFCDCEVK